ncbi:MAG: radical SAM protein, partial [Planctomycetes bacterium]|nr:radical SAM protein [Planctomycetota bacterium]
QLGCRYCCDGDGVRFAEEPIEELDTAAACRLVSILARAADTIDVTGGEPMVRPDLEAILAHAQAAGLRTVLNTKGIGLVERPDVLRHSNVLVLSIDTLDPARLAGLIGRPPAVAQRVLAALEFALAHRDGTTLVVSAVATPDNLDDVAQVLAFARRHGIGFHLSPEIVGTRAHPALRESAAYKALVDGLRAAKGAGVLGVPAYLRGIRDFRDYACHPLLMPVIRPDGRLYYPCLESRNAEVNVLEAGDYPRALARARSLRGEIPRCRGCCHIFCHMALSLLQRHPLQALREAGVWRSLTAGAHGRTAVAAGTGVQEGVGP